MSRIRESRFPGLPGQPIIVGIHATLQTDADSFFVANANYQQGHSCSPSNPEDENVARFRRPFPRFESLYRLARDLDVLLALAGKVSADLRAIICRRPRLFADLTRQLKETPDEAVRRIVREGNW